MNSPVFITVPAEQWALFSKTCACSTAAEHKGDKPMSLRTFDHGAFSYASFSVNYGPWGGRNSLLIGAYKLLPESLYAGETTIVYHDEAAIKAGLRDRGDLTGLIVSCKGKRLVCADKVDFLMGLPKTQCLSFHEAEAYDDETRHHGWRLLFYSCANREWFSLEGHPVALYRKDQDNSQSVLFWKSEGKVHELSLQKGLQLSPLAQSADPAVEGQLALF